MVLTDLAGTTVVNATSIPGAVNPDGTPIVQTYQTYMTAHAGTYYTGTGPNNGGMVLVDANGKLYNNATAPAGYSATGSAPAGYAWALLTNQDKAEGTALYKWNTANYALDPKVGGANGAQFKATSGGGAGDQNNFYVIDGNGKAVTGTAYLAALGNPVGESVAISNACGGYTTGAVASTANAANCLAQIKAAAVAAGNTSATNGWQVVSGLAPDTTLAANNSGYSYQGVPSSTAQGQGNGTVEVQGATASTTSLAGGVVYANNLGQSTVIGPDGITGTGWTLTVQNIGGTSKTTISDGNIVASDSITSNGTLTVKGASAFGSAGQATIDGNGNIGTSGTLTVGGLTTLNGGLAVHGGTTTDMLTVTGASTTHGITNNGNITNTGNIATNTLTTTGSATIGGQAYLNGGATIKNNLTVSGPGNGGTATNIDMGGNVVHDVATPIVGTDATNKAYVDKGLNKAYEGTAIALAISQPVFLPGQTFAMRGGWGGYEGQNAFGVSVAGVIAHNTFGYGSTVSLDGGIGAGNSSVAGKAGVTVGFGGGSAPLK
jgi:hypothetical protein